MPIPSVLKSEKARNLFDRIFSGAFADWVTVNAQITRLHIMGDEAIYLREYAKSKLPGRSRRPQRKWLENS